MKHIDILPRKEAEKYSYSYDTTWVCISITNPGERAGIDISSFYDILRVQFEDIETFASSTSFLSPLNDFAITTPIAKTIYDFIVVNDNMNFMIHCEAGISRSVAVGKFLMEYDSEFELRKHEAASWAPNRLVLDKLHEVSGMNSSYIDLWEEVINYEEG